MRSPKSWYVKWTDESSSRKDSSFPWMCYDLSDVGSQILIWIILMVCTHFLLQEFKLWKKYRDTGLCGRNLGKWPFNRNFFFTTLSCIPFVFQYENWILKFSIFLNLEASGQVLFCEFIFSQSGSHNCAFTLVAKISFFPWETGLACNTYIRWKRSTMRRV